MIGDKPRWYSHYLEPNYYQVHNPHSKLGHDLLDDSDDSGPLYEDEDDFTDSDISIDDNEYFQLSTERTLSADMELTAKAREVHMNICYFEELMGIGEGRGKGTTNTRSFQRTT